MYTGTCVGTVFKIAVNIEGLCPMTMDDVDFFCEFYCYPGKMVRIDKSRMKRENACCYLAVVDSAELGTGEIRVRVTALVPDADCPEGMRMEVCSADTGIKVNKV